MISNDFFHYLADIFRLLVLTSSVVWLTLAECKPCNKPGHICDPDTGECVCPPNTEGPNCERCIIKAYDFDNTKGCKVGAAWDPHGQTAVSWLGAGIPQGLAMTGVGGGGEGLVFWLWVSVLVVGQPLCFARVCLHCWAGSTKSNGVSVSNSSREWVCQNNILMICGFVCACFGVFFFSAHLQAIDGLRQFCAQKAV